MNSPWGTLLILTAVAAVVIIAAVGVLLKRRKAAPIRFAPDYTWADVAADLEDEPEEEGPSWWAIGALSDIRRRAADRGDLAEFAGIGPLLDAPTWRRLADEWFAVRERVTPPGPVGWSLGTRATTAPADALAYDRYPVVTA